MPRSRRQQSVRDDFSQNESQFTQGSQAPTEINLNIDDQVNDLVRYIVNRAGGHMTFKRSDFKKHVLSKAGPNFETIVNRATEVLRNVYGYNMLVVDAKANATKAYVVSNKMNYIKDPEVTGEEKIPDDVHSILILLILSHIFMSNNCVTDASLYAFLRSFNIDVEVRHEIFGNVKEYIMNTLKSKKYLEIELDHMSKKTNISWGVRAEAEISKHDILKFVCKMFNDRQPTSWVNQYKVATEQQFENYKENIVMEVEESQN